MLPQEKDVFRLEKNGEFHLNGFDIVQICDIQTDVGSICPVHVQSVCEISYVAKGNCKHTVNNDEIELGQGDVLFLREGDVHSYVTDDKAPARIFNVGLRVKKNDFGSSGGLIDVWNVLYSHPTPLVIYDVPKVEKIFIQIFEELVKSGFYWDYAVQLSVERMLLIICRTMKKNEDVAYRPEGRAAKRKRLLYSIINYIDTHEENIDALKDMCATFHYSYPYLSHFFKDMMGISLSDYNKQKRFAYAAESLQREQYSVTEIAEKMGYHSIHAFSKAFNKYYGMSPTRYVEVKKRTDENHIV